MKLRKTMLLPALLALASAAGAEEVNAVAFWKTDGQKVTVLLDEQPKVTFTDEEMRVTTRTHEWAFPAGDVERFTYEWAAPTKIDAPGLREVCFHLSDGRLLLSALPANSPVEVYALDGKKQLDATAGEAGDATADMRPLPAGLYVIKTAVGNFKIRKP